MSDITVQSELSPEVISQIVVKSKAITEALQDKFPDLPIALHQENGDDFIFINLGMSAQAGVDPTTDLLLYTPDKNDWIYAQEDGYTGTVHSNLGLDTSVAELLEWVSVEMASRNLS